MPKSCCIFQCTNHKKKAPELSFYLIPNEATESERRKQWLTAISRGKDGNNGKLWDPKSDYHYVCSAHFITGSKNNYKGHPDYVPSIFPQRQPVISASPGKRKVARYQRLEKKRKRDEAVVPTSRQKFSDTRPPAEISEPSSPLLGHDQEVTPQPPTAGTSSNATSSSSSHGISSPLESQERTMIYTEMANLRQERNDANDLIKSLKEALHGAKLSVKSIEGDDNMSKKMTGVSWKVFEQVFKFLSKYMPVNCVMKDSLPLQEQFFMTLVKLRHDISFEILASLKGIKKTTAIDYFWKWINLLHAKLGFLIKFQDRENIFRTIPPVFKTKFPRLTSIIDCFEIFMEAPRNLKARAQCWSNYKSHTTLKVFISCSPLGHVNFLSKAYGGRVSDVQITRECGFMSSDLHMPGDQVLADRGFTLKEELATACGAHLLTPAFTKGKSQLSAEEVETSRQISCVRIHIERVIGLLKNRFTILKGTLSVQTVQQISNEAYGRELSSVDKIIRVCACLLNLGESIVYKETL